MKTLLTTFLITAVTLVLVGWLIAFCRKKLAGTTHGLSGMCHRQGGEVCSSCADRAVKEAENAKKTGKEIKNQRQEGV